MPSPRIDPLQAQRAVHRCDVSALTALVLAVLGIASASISILLAALGIIALAAAAALAALGIYARGVIAGSRYAQPGTPPPAAPAAPPTDGELELQEPDDDTDEVVVMRDVIPVVRTRFRNPIQEMEGGIRNPRLTAIIESLLRERGLPAGDWEFLGERHLRDQGMFEQLWAPARMVDRS
jgi:hypothetical protein